MDRTIVLFLAGVVFTQSLVRAFPKALPKSFPCTEIATGQRNVNLDCVVNQGQYLDYRNIRELTRSRTNGEKFNISIACVDGGKAYLPWPFRAANVISLKVTGCVVEGFLAERLVKQVGQDELKVLVLSDVIIEVPLDQMYDTMSQLSNMTKEFECGPTNIQEYVFRNAQYNFPPPNDLITESLLLEKILSADMMKTILNRQTVCEYPDIRRLEESGSRSLSSIHFKLVQENKYPELREYSIRNNSLGRIPNELKNLAFSFLPSLEKLDLSHNNIDKLDFVMSHVPQRRPRVYIDMRGNNVRSLGARLVYYLGSSSNAVIDLRNNPLTCSCSLYLYGLYLEKLSQSDQSLTPLRDLSCFSLQGASFSLLDSNFGRRFCPGFV